MASVGPELPPHLAKRKRGSDEEDNERNSQSSKNTDSDGTEKRRRIIGPAMPPAPLDERPSEPADHSDDSSDDDFGPALPPPPGSVAEQRMEAARQAAEEEAAVREKEKKPQREEWMLLPPTNDDWSARVDPTKLKNRKFHTGKGSKAPIDKSAGISAIWTETPEQKRQRLEDEVLGRKATASSGTGKPTISDREPESAAYVKQYNDENRSTSLYEEHKKAVPREKEDDPSKRAFDKEKDMGLGRKIGHAQKKEMLSKAADFGSRFAKGSYL